MMDTQTIILLLIWLIIILGGLNELMKMK